MYGKQSNKRLALLRPLSLKCSTFPNDRSVSLLALDLLLDLLLLLLRFVPTVLDLDGGSPLDIRGNFGPFVAKLSMLLDQNLGLAFSPLALLVGSNGLKPASDLTKVASRQKFGNFRERFALGHLLLDDAILFGTEGCLADLGVEVIVPSSSTLFRCPRSGEVNICDALPPLVGIRLDSLAQIIILLLRPFRRLLLLAGIGITITTSAAAVGICGRTSLGEGVCRLPTFLLALRNDNVRAAVVGEEESTWVVTR